MVALGVVTIFAPMTKWKKETIINTGLAIKHLNNTNKCDIGDPVLI